MKEFNVATHHAGSRLVVSRKGDTRLTKYLDIRKDARYEVLEQYEIVHNGQVVESGMIPIPMGPEFVLQCMREKL